MVKFSVFGRGKNVMGNGRLPYLLSFEVVPYKLFAGRKSSATLFLKVKNASKEELMTSLSVELPQKLSFENVGLSRVKEIRLGSLKPGEEREQKVQVMNALDADKGDYTLTITTTAHFNDYDHIMNSIKKRVSISVV
jgi:uncharacterized membrane protein